MGIIIFKEIVSYFSSLAGYITILVFLVVLGLFLWVFPESSILEYGYAGLDSMFNILPYLFIFLIPAVSMRTFSEEKKEGTFELLATKPLTDWQIILGKYFAVLLVVVVALLPTLVYYLSVYFLGNPVGNIDSGAVIGSYIGALLLAAVFTALGVFTSAITKNQIIAFALSVFLSFFMFSGFGSLSQILSLQHISYYLTSLGLEEHYQSVGRGVLDTRDLIYFLSITAFFLLATRTVLRSRVW
ncbi:gliding motility-associated ABC transporter permease subunit GldF [Pseudopedobacter beijingensis]|uniref:Gliding motility-associated ABC transporter permease subunit GldF n=1 Tax=Pseudopedobacter beijingensis TaxID=1207056 RepID=A0ABW4IET5_9SPHI